uniref:Uncharacterized protein n=1 Tax=Tanacetum cinerariifolium TaxID=118510 RepID=A0A6L2J210_TANCI|nr:hypothetical protein [Tanacetum cinerariifolium]
MFFLLLVIMVVGDPYGSTILINNIDAGNPLRMNPNDYTSTALIPFKVLGTENYSVMKLALQAKNKIAFVDWSCLKTAYMSKLESTYDKVDGSVIFNLLNKINCVKQGGNSVADYYHSYQSVRSALLTRDPLSEVKDAYTTVSREESYRAIPESSNVVDSKLNDTSFVVKSFTNNNRKSNNNVNTKGHTTANGNKGPNPNLLTVLFDLVDSFEKSEKLTFVDFSCAKRLRLTVHRVSYEKLLSLINETPTESVHANLVGGHPNGTLATISHVGILKLTNNVVLCDVLIGHGYCVDLKRETFLGIRSESGGMYLFNMDMDRLLAIVPRSSIEVEDRCITSSTSNPVLHEKTKHFDVDVHVVREKVKAEAQAEYTESWDQINLCSSSEFDEGVLIATFRDRAKLMKSELKLAIHPTRISECGYPKQVTLR